MLTTIADIRDFLAQRRIAMVGVSRDPKDFSRMLFREMRQRGYEIIPVNPGTEELEGSHCFVRVQDIAPPPDAALIMTSPRDTERVVRDCAEAGVARVWMHRGGGQGAVSEAAVNFCRTKSMRLVEGYCPFMFLSRTGLIHRVHGFLLKLLGGYPDKAHITPAKP